MSIQVRFFASLREEIGREGAEVAAGQVRTVADVWRQVAGDRPLGGRVLAAVNMEYARADTPVQDGDEVAFFPPVTGGRR